MQLCCHEWHVYINDPSGGTRFNRQGEDAKEQQHFINLATGRSLTDQHSNLVLVVKAILMQKLGSLIHKPHAVYSVEVQLQLGHPDLKYPLAIPYFHLKNLLYPHLLTIRTIPKCSPEEAAVQPGDKITRSVSGRCTIRRTRRGFSTQTTVVHQHKHYEPVQ